MPVDEVFADTGGARRAVGFDAIAVALIVMSAFILYRHNRNIAKLLAGKESRIGGTRKPAARTRSTR